MILICFQSVLRRLGLGAVDMISFFIRIDPVKDCEGIFKNHIHLPEIQPWQLFRQDGPAFLPLAQRLKSSEVALDPQERPHLSLADPQRAMGAKQAFLCFVREFKTKIP